MPLARRLLTIRLIGRQRSAADQLESQHLFPDPGLSGTGMQS
jgi:hypothetical protein